MRKVIIMRGISGSGKSTLARKLAGTSGRIHSTDDYFERNGAYHFNPRELGRAHNANYTAFVGSLRRGVPVVICDNTNSTHAEFKRYIEAAESHGYEFEIVPLPHLNPAIAASRSTHHVPEATVRRMLERWEP